MNIIKGRKLSYDYFRVDEDGKEEEAVRAVDQVDLDVKEGDFVAILGHNGSGKSTLAKHINAILLPTEGTLYVDGKDTKDESKLWEIRQSAGMVFQNPDNQIIGTIVDEDVGFGPENMGVPTKEIWERVEKSLKAVGMWEYRSHSPNKLSGGQKQRVALARTLVMKPRLLLLDEPLSALDGLIKESIKERIRTIARQLKLTTLIVTHDPEEALTLSDKVLIINGGRIAQFDTPQGIVHRPADDFVRRFILSQLTIKRDNIYRLFGQPAAEQSLMPAAS